jgi:hypothetical protein
MHYFRSTTEPIQLGALPSEDLLCLGANGLREKHRALFEAYDRQIRDAKANRSRSEQEDKGFVNRRLEEDESKLQQEVQNIIRGLYDEVYPCVHIFIRGYQHMLLNHFRSSLQLASEVSHGPETSGINPLIAFNFRVINVFAFAATLQHRYSGLGKVANDIKNKYKLDVIHDKKFPALKRKWFLVKEYLTANPTASKADQTDFANDVLNGSANNPPSKPVVASQSGGIRGFVAAGYNVIWGRSSAASQQASPRLNEDSNHIKDPDFVAQLRPFEGRFPVISKITEQIYSCLQDDLRALESKCLRDYVQRITSGEQRRQNDHASTARDRTFRGATDQALQHLLGGLREAMSTTAR